MSAVGARRMLAPAALLFCLTARAAEPAPAPSCDDPPGLLGSEDALAGRFRALLPAAEACAEREGLPPARRASSLVALARLRLAAGDAAGAEASLKRALAEVPGDAEASYWLARAARDRPDEALASAEASARRAADPRRRASARRLAAEIRLDLGDAAGARREAEAALADAPADLDAWAALARARRDDPKAAAQAAARAETAAAATPLWLRPAAL
ncbi:MAG: hypothetical protein HY079_08155, partial [Elusimicrobia bacterium]|nr:hypothetical protein [Elusimicrobiota bacterium]